MRVRKNVAYWMTPVGLTAAALAPAAGHPLQVASDGLSALLAEGVEDDRLGAAFDAFLAALQAEAQAPLAWRRVSVLARQLTVYEVFDSLRPGLLDLQTALAERAVAEKDAANPALLLALSDVVQLRNTYDVMAGAAELPHEVAALQVAVQALTAAGGAVDAAPRVQLLWAAVTLLARPDVSGQPTLKKPLEKALEASLLTFEKVKNRAAPNEFYRGSFVRASDQTLSTLISTLKIGPKKVRSCAKNIADPKGTDSGKGFGGAGGKGY